MRNIPAIYLRVEAQKRHFCRYMAKIRAIFRSKSAHGTKFPWDGSADPWDGNRNPWDGSTKGPLPAAFPTLKGGRTRASALTVCHIAHTAVGHFRRRLRGASNRKGGSLRRGGIPAARKRSGRQPRLDIFSSRWAVRLCGRLSWRPKTLGASAPPRHFFLAVGRAGRGGRCVVLSHGSNVHAAGLTAPRGPNYSITAGKRSAPAVRMHPTMTAPRGSNAREA